MSIFNREARDGASANGNSDVTPGPSDYDIDRFSNANRQASCQVKIVDSVAIGTDENLRSSFMKAKINKHGLLVAISGDRDIVETTASTVSHRYQQTRPASYKRPRSKPRPFVPRTCLLSDPKTAALAKGTPGPTTIYTGPRGEKTTRMPCAIIGNGITTSEEYSSLGPSDLSDGIGISDERDGWANGMVHERTGFLMTSHTNNTIGPASFGIAERSAAEKKLLPTKHQQGFSKASRFVSKAYGAVVSPGPIYHPVSSKNKDGVSWSKAIPPGTAKVAAVRDARRQEIEPGPGEFHRELGLVKRSFNERANNPDFSAKPLAHHEFRDEHMRKINASGSGNANLGGLCATRNTLTRFLELTNPKPSEYYSDDVWTQRSAVIKIQTATRGRLAEGIVFSLKASAKRRAARAAAKKEAKLKRAVEASANQTAFSPLETASNVEEARSQFTQEVAQMQEPLRTPPDVVVEAGTVTAQASADTEGLEAQQQQQREEQTTPEENFDEDKEEGKDEAGSTQIEGTEEHREAPSLIAGQAAMISIDSDYGDDTFEDASLTATILTNDTEAKTGGTVQHTDTAVEDLHGDLATTAHTSEFESE